MTDAFGYRPEDKHQVKVAAVQVGEAKSEDTLEPHVVVYMRFAMDPDEDFAYIEIDKATDLDLPPGEAATQQLAMPLNLTMAEYLIDQLQWGVKRARERHFEE